jgi:hypothetical protein
VFDCSTSFVFNTRDLAAGNGAKFRGARDTKYFILSYIIKLPINSYIFDHFKIILCYEINFK